MENDGLALHFAHPTLDRHGKRHFLPEEASHSDVEFDT